MSALRPALGRPRLLLVLALLIAPAVPPTSRAANLSWNNGGSGNASTAANWLPAQVPAAADNLTFNLAGSRTISWNSTVGSSTSHTYRTGNTTLTFLAPHFASGSCVLGAALGDVPTVSVAVGTFVTGGTSTIGSVAGSGGQLNVTGSNVLFQVQNAASDLFVAQNGTGVLQITAGGVVRVADDIVIGSGVGTNGSVTVSGASALNASTLEAAGPSGSIFVGSSGTGTLTVSSDADVTAVDDLFIASGSGSSGTTTVGGTGSTATIQDDCFVAANVAVSAAGTGTLNVNSGATVLVRDQLVVGDLHGGTGTLHLNGGLVHVQDLTIEGTHGVIDFDGGRLRIDGGMGTLDGPTLSLGSTAGPAALEVVRGAIVSKQNDVFILTEAGQTSTLAVDSGASLTIANDLVLTSGTAAVTIDSSAVLTTVGDVNLGGSSSNTSLAITHGGALNCVTFESADEAGAVSTITVFNAGSRINFSGPFFLGGDAGHAGGAASATLSTGGGLVGTTASSDILVYPLSSLTVGFGGSLTTPGDVNVQGTLSVGQASMTAAVVQLEGNGRLLGSGTVNARIASTSATSRIDATGGLTVGNSASTTGFAFAGTLDHTGIGIVTLRDQNAAQLGDTTTLGGGTLRSTTSMSVNNGFVNARGTIDTPIFLVGGLSGLLAVQGTGPGILAMTGQYTQSQGTLRLRVNGTDAGEADRVNVAGLANLGGPLRLVFDPNGTYAAGVPITLMTYGSRSGSFNAVIVEGISPAAFSLVYEPTAVQIVFNTAVAAPAELPHELAFTGHSGAASWLELALPRAAEVHVALYDVRGRERARLLDGPTEPGIHRVALPAGLERGVYFARALVAGEPARRARVVVF
jgi:T5SS/PEP-CTERM-associated repeat protein